MTAGTVAIRCGCSTCGSAKAEVTQQKWRWLNRHNLQNNLIHEIVAEAIAERERQSGQSSLLGVDKAIEGTDTWWRDVAMNAITWLAELGQPFTAYDVSELGVPDPDDHHRWGSVMRYAATQGVIKPVGFAPSRRPSASGSIARVWLGVSAGVVDKAG